MAFYLQGDGSGIFRHRLAVVVVAPAVFFPLLIYRIGCGVLVQRHLVTQVGYAIPVDIHRVVIADTIAIEVAVRGFVIRDKGVLIPETLAITVRILAVDEPIAVLIFKQPKLDEIGILVPRAVSGGKAQRVRARPSGGESGNRAVFRSDSILRE